MDTYDYDIMVRKEAVYKEWGFAAFFMNNHSRYHTLYRLINYPIPKS